MSNNNRLVLPSAEQMAMAQAQQRAAQVQANNQIAFARAAMAASAAGSRLSTIAVADVPASEADIELAVDDGFRVADRCLKRIGLNVAEAKTQEAAP